MRRIINTMTYYMESSLQLVFEVAVVVAEILPEVKYTGSCRSCNSDTSICGKTGKTTKAFCVDISLIMFHVMSKTFISK